MAVIFYKANKPQILNY